MNPFSKSKSPNTAPDQNPAVLIGGSLQAVEALRCIRCTDPSLSAAVDWIKAFQHQRFEKGYADLMNEEHFSATTHFFLNRLYGQAQPQERDAQFARIAPTISKLFSAEVVNTAVKVSALHELTESLDHRMAQQLLDLSTPQPLPALTSNTAFELYVRAWQATGNPMDRQKQLDQVLGLGTTMGDLVKVPGLLVALKVMRGPARMAHLGDLQNWLEEGFSTFKQLCRKPGALDYFLTTVRSRESVLIDALFKDNPSLGIAALQRATHLFA